MNARRRVIEACVAHRAAGPAFPTHAILTGDAQTASPARTPLQNSTWTGQDSPQPRLARRNVTEGKLVKRPTRPLQILLALAQGVTSFQALAQPTGEPTPLAQTVAAINLKPKWQRIEIKEQQSKSYRVQLDYKRTSLHTPIVVGGPEAAADTKEIASAVLAELVKEGKNPCQGPDRHLCSCATRGWKRADRKASTPALRQHSLRLQHRSTDISRISTAMTIPTTGACSPVPRYAADQPFPSLKPLLGNL
jgi:hypothetical protein